MTLVYDEESIHYRTCTGMAISQIYRLLSAIMWQRVSKHSWATGAREELLDFRSWLLLAIISVMVLEVLCHWNVVTADRAVVHGTVAV